MLRITIPSIERYDEVNNLFIDSKEQHLQLEHSLVSISKWESKWQKPFLAKKEMTEEETLDYVKCMTLTKNINPDVYNHLTKENIKDIVDYISNPMTATTFSKDEKSQHNREIITSELIYYWMIASNIPIEECQKWHLNRLLTLIRVCSVKNAPPKKRSKRDIMSRNAALNASRRKQLNTRG